MLKRSKEKELRARAAEIIRASGFPVKEEELEKMAVADFGLSNPEVEGAQILTLFATERISAKLIVLFPGQYLPEHWHPPVGSDPGKEEILRGYYGECIYAEEGPDTCPKDALLKGKEDCYSTRSFHVMKPGEQVIIPSGKVHWIGGGKKGGIVISFSTCVRDALDQFTDKNVKRITEFEED